MDPNARKEFVLILLTIVLSGVASMMYVLWGADMRVENYRNFLYAPSIVLVFVLLIYARGKYPRLANRIVAGLISGAIATIGLEAVRQPGVFSHILPMDEPTTLGLVLITAKDMHHVEMMMHDKHPIALGIVLAGYLWHFWNGGTFGVVYTLLFGKAQWFYGLVWGFLIEVGMMTLPPMTMMGGLFMLKMGYGPFAVTLVAHLVWGTILGLLAHRLVKDKGSILTVLASAKAQ